MNFERGCCKLGNLPCAIRCIAETLRIEAVRVSGACFSSVLSQVGKEMIRKEARKKKCAPPMACLMCSGY